MTKSLVGSAPIYRAIALRCPGFESLMEDLSAPLSLTSLPVYNTVLP